MFRNRLLVATYHQVFRDAICDSSDSEFIDVSPIASAVLTAIPQYK